MERHAADVGIRPEAVRAAADRLPTLRAHPAVRLLGGPFEVEREVELPGDLDPETVGRVFDAARRVLKRPGRVEELLGAVEWVPRGQESEVATTSLELTSAGNRIRLRLHDKRGVEAGIYLGSLPLGGAFAAALVAGAAGAPELAIGLAAAAGALASLVGTGLALRGRGRRHRRRLDRLVAEVRRAVTGEERGG